MPVKIVQDRKFALLKVPFAWGFDDGARRGNVAIPDSPPGVASLVGEIHGRLAGAGWDVPGFEVRFTVSECREGIFRHVESISGGEGKNAFVLTHGLGRGLLGDRSHLSMKTHVTIGGESFPDDASGWVGSQTDRFEDAMLTALSGLAGCRPSPGARGGGYYGDGNIRRFYRTIPSPAPADFPVLYVWRQRDERKPAPGGPVLENTGYRLCVNYRAEDRSSLPERYFDCFDYASTELDTKAEHAVHYVSDDSVPIEVRLRYLDEVYVMDLGARDAARERVEAAMRAEGRKRSTDEEQREVNASAARTVVPAADYRGGYVRPVYLIGRILMADEARPMTGRIRIGVDDGILNVSMLDAVSGLTARFMSESRFGEATMHDYLRSARAFARTVGGGLEVTEEFRREVGERRRRWRERQPADTEPVQPGIAAGSAGP